VYTRCHRNDSVPDNLRFADDQGDIQSKCPVRPILEKV
jgi:hypothetical protein